MKNKPFWKGVMPAIATQFSAKGEPAKVALNTADALNAANNVVFYGDKTIVPTIEGSARITGCTNFIRKREFLCKRISRGIVWEKR